MPRAKTVNYGLECFSYIDSKLWDSIPSHIKEIDSINKFKHVIKTWKSDLCSLQTLQSLFTKYWIYVASIQKKQKKTYMYTKMHIRLGKSEYHNRFSLLPYVAHLLFLV